MKPEVRWAYDHIFSILGAVMLGLFFFIMFLAIYMKFPSHLWSYGKRWPLQYEHSQPLHLKPSSPVFLLQVKQREWSCCLGGTCSIISGTFMLVASSFIFVTCLCCLDEYWGTYSISSTCSCFEDCRRTDGSWRSKDPTSIFISNYCN